MTSNYAIGRDRLIAKLQKAYPTMMLRYTEEFDGEKGGIWTSGEDAPLDKTGMPIFDYWAEDYWAKDYKNINYIFGVRKHLHEFLERNGWYAQWHDAGTMMLYPA